MSNILAIPELLDEHNGDVDAVVSLLFNAESNYNNADKTSGQVVYTESELSALVNEVKHDD